MTLKVCVGPSRIFGRCPAGHQTGDELVIDRTIIKAVKGPLCYVAISAFTDQVTQIQRHERVTSHLSCPGCCFDSDQENRVVFILSSEDAWELSKKYSKYNWGRTDGRATKTSARYCDLCWKLTKAGKYSEAERAIEQAIRRLKPLAEAGGRNTDIF